jgi:hypothetical protein
MHIKSLHTTTFSLKNKTLAGFEPGTSMYVFHWQMRRPLCKGNFVPFNVSDLQQAKDLAGQSKR